VHVRVSIGSLSELGIYKIYMLARPTTLYILQYFEKGCLASCRFCPQSSTNNADKSYVSRVPWLAVPLDVLIEKVKEKGRVFARVCIQSVLKPGFEEEILEIIYKIKNSGINLPISTALTPIDVDVLRQLKKIGVDHVGVGLDAATPEVFHKVGKPYSWERYMKFIDEAVEVFGKGNVVVHLIFGLGEKIEEFIQTMKLIYRKGCEVALFAFTPVRGTCLAGAPQPYVLDYRVAQIARFLLSKKVRKIPEAEALLEALLTSGCPGCNRPFYNESPRRMYNYPSRELLERDKAKLIGEIVEALSRINLDSLVR